MIRRAKRNNADSVVCAIGCYTQVFTETVSKIDEVDIIMGSKNKIDLVNEVENYKNEKKILVEDILKEKEYENINIHNYDDRSRAYIKIQDGCSQFCSYCIIPYARGPVRSKDINKIIDEAKTLSENGFKELVLTGIHVASYGKDLKGASLSDVIRGISEIDNIKRIRLSSIEPVGVDLKFLKEISDIEKVCPHFHVSLQSGCDETLDRMDRKYKSAEYKSTIESIRKYFKDAAITTDVMVGFPGETDEEFEKSYEFVKSIGFYNVHVFKYSRRKGTKADKFENQVSPDKKEERSKRLLNLVVENEKKFIQNYIGKTVSVLFENTNLDKDIYKGHTMNYIPVEVQYNKNIKGQIHNVLLEKNMDTYAFGKII